MWRYPFGSGGKRVTTPGKWPDARSLTTSSRMKWEGLSGGLSISRIVPLRGDQIPAVVVPAQRAALAKGSPGLQDRPVLDVVQLAQQLVEGPGLGAEQRDHAVGDGRGRH